MRQREGQREGEIFLKVCAWDRFNQGILEEGEGSVQLTSLN